LKGANGHIGIASNFAAVGGGGEVEGGAIVAAADGDNWGAASGTSAVAAGVGGGWGNGPSVVSTGW